MGCVMKVPCGVNVLVQLRISVGAHGADVPCGLDRTSVLPIVIVGSLTAGGASADGLARMSAILSAGTPKRRNTSSVCCPISGAAVRKAPGVRENLVGMPMVFMLPNAGCSSSCTMPRAR